MTSHPDDDPLLRDPRFDRTWRAVSAEEPPAALGDALLSLIHISEPTRPY